MARRALVLPLLTTVPVAVLSGARLPLARLSEVTGEVRVESARHRAQRPPWVALGSEVEVRAGVARIDSDLPATIWADAGDRLTLSAGPARYGGRRGLRVEAAPGALLDIEVGGGRVLVGDGSAVLLSPGRGGLVWAEVERGAAELLLSGAAQRLGQGAAAALMAGAPGWRAAGLDMAGLTTRRRASGRRVAMSIRSPPLTLAQVAESAPPLRAEETDLRMAVGARPPAGGPARPGTLPAPGRRPQARAPAAEAGAPPPAAEGAVELDGAAAALAVAAALALVALWARRVSG